MLHVTTERLDAWLAAGRAHFDAGRLAEAEACFRAVVAANPNDLEAQVHLGRTLGAQEKTDEAVALLRKVIERQPDFFAAHEQWGLALQRAARFDEAAEAFQRLADVCPNVASVCHALGFNLMSAQRVDEAIAAYEKSIALQPTVEAYCNLSVLLDHAERLEEAVAAARRAVALRPDDPRLQCNLALALCRLQRTDEAEAIYRKVQAAHPTLPILGAHLGSLLLAQGKAEEALLLYRESAAANRTDVIQDDNVVFAAHFVPGISSADLYAEHQRWNRIHALPLSRDLAPHTNGRSPERVLRIGYVSPDFYDHVVGRNLVPLFDHHDHARFHITAYSCGPTRDAVTRRLQAGADQWRNILRMTDAQAARLVRDDAIDILVELAMHTNGNRLLLFAQKPAPLQVAFVGYPGTSGLTAIDYRLTDPYLEPLDPLTGKGLFDDCSSEKVMRLPATFWCYNPIDAVLPAGELPAAGNGCVTFGCLNNYMKVNPGLLRLWGRVLAAVPGSRLLLLTIEGRHRQFALDVLRESGIDADRIAFAAPRSRLKYMELYHSLDISLDTLPYNGHTTSLDSLWMGVPVVTLVGETVVGRAGLSQLTNLGMPELVATTADQYVTIAAKLAADRGRLAELRRGLRGRMEASPLMDGRAFARGIEEAYRAMWRHWCAAAPA